MLGDTLTKDKAERDARSAEKALESDTTIDGEVRSNGRRAVGRIVFGKSHGLFARGSSGAPIKVLAESELPAKSVHLNQPAEKKKKTPR